MIKSWKNGEIVYLKITGEFLADEVIGETSKWLNTQRDQYVGYIVDLCEMTKQSAVEQKKSEAAAKANNSGKPRALLGKDAGTAALVNIYQRFTGAQGMRYFTNEQEAIKWVMSFKK